MIGATPYAAIEAAPVVARAARPIASAAQRVGDALNRRLFNRETGLLNTNRFIRIGRGWNGRREVFRVAIGRQPPYNVFGYRVNIHWQWDLRGSQ